MARAANLKVFRTRIGFYESIIAVGSKKAALEAWGVHQDLFADGAAALATDEAEIAAAKASPGVVLKRPTGTTKSFTADTKLQPGDVAVSKSVGEARRRSTAKIQGLPPAPANRAQLTDAENALAAVEGELASAMADLDRRQNALDADRTRIKQAFSEKRKAAIAALDKSRRAFKAAGGKV